VDHTRLHDGLRPDRGHRVGQAGQPVADQDAHVLDAAVTDVGEHLMPVLGAFTAAAGPQAQDVAFAVDGDADDDVVPVRNNWSVACRCGQ